MPPRKRSKNPRPQPADGGSGNDESQGAPVLGRNPDADPVRIHRDYVERRIGGGAAPTSEAYARALDQFHRIPGAVRRPASESTGGTAAERSEPEPVREDAAGGAPGGDVPQDADDFTEALAADDAVAHTAGDAGPDEDTSGAWEPGR